MVRMKLAKATAANRITGPTRPSVPGYDTLGVHTVELLLVPRVEQLEEGVGESREAPWEASIAITTPLITPITSPRMTTIRYKEIPFRMLEIDVRVIPLGEGAAPGGTAYQAGEYPKGGGGSGGGGGT
jgi:hypothetical protein